MDVFYSVLHHGRIGIRPRPTSQPPRQRRLRGAATHGGGDNGATGDAAPSTVPPLEPYPWPVLTTAPLEPDGGAEATEEAAEGGYTQEAALAGAEAEEREWDDAHE